MRARVNMSKLSMQASVNAGRCQLWLGPMQASTKAAQCQCEPDANTNVWS